MRRSALLWLLPLCAAALVTAATIMAVTSRMPPMPQDLFSEMGSPILAAVCFTTAGVILVRHGAPAGLAAVMILIGGVFAFAMFATEYANRALISSPGSLPGGIYAALGSQVVFANTFPLFGLMFVLFPAGRPHRRSGHALMWALLTVMAIDVLAAAFAQTPISPSLRQLRNDYGPNPLAIPALHAIIGRWGLMFGLAILLSVAALLSQVVRYRRARGVERQQIKWLVFAGAVAGVALATTVVASRLSNTYRFDESGPVGAVSFHVMALCLTVGVPVSIAIAALRHRLYDIDVVISRTLVYGSLAAFITAVYVGIVAGAGSLLGSAGARSNLALSIVATAVVAVAFQPVRERAERLANRLVYGRRATPYEVLSHFSAQVGASYGDDVLLHMSRLLAEGTGAESAAVWSRSGDTLRCVAQWPAADGAPACVVRRGELPSLPGAGYQAAVKHQGELLGALALSKRRGEGLSPFEEKLVNDLAHQAALILRNTTLAADLRAHVEELRESRQRLVRAQDEERRRLERNLHDGAQQNLVALKVKLSLAESMLAKDPVAAKRKLGELKSDADEALETLRDLARGIYPPLLAEQGLRAAMEAQARRAAVPVTVEAGGLSRHAQDVEAAVYFCVLEALQNAQKHAHTPTVTVRLSESDGRLRFSVRDEGRGFDAGSAHGSGLQNMRDRVDALGGRLEVVSAAGAGTEVRGALPVEPARSARVESVAGGGLPGLEQAVGTEL